MSNEQALILYELIKRYACYECNDDCENCKVGKLREKCVEMMKESNALQFIDELKHYIDSQDQDEADEIILRKLLKYGFIKKEGKTYYLFDAN